MDRKQNSPRSLKRPWAKGYKVFGEMYISGIGLPTSGAQLSRWDLVAKYGIGIVVNFLPFSREFVRFFQPAIAGFNCVGGPVVR